MEAQEHSKYDLILGALEGSTVLAKPKVSRDVIVEVLKEHTELIRSLRTDLLTANALAAQQSQEISSIKAHFDTLQDELKRNKAEISSSRKVNAKLAEEIKDIKQELGITQVKIAGLGNIMELEQKTHKLTLDYNEFKKDTKTNLVTLQDKSREAEDRLVEVKQMVQDTGEQLVLPSSQITVDAPGGGKGLLAEVLAEYSVTLASTKKTLQEHMQQLVANKVEISTKADANVTFDLDAVSGRLKVIEIQVKKDSEQGVGEIRRQCEDLTSSVEKVQIDLAEKISRENVDLIVHRKYEDIVQYLHEALQASKSDEEAFNKKADELRDAVKRLGISKADRFEIASMQEAVMKTESIVAKLKTQEVGAEREKAIDGVTRAELLELLATKTDVADFAFLQRQVAGRRRSPPSDQGPDSVGPNYVRGEAIRPLEAGPAVPVDDGDSVGPSSKSAARGSTSQKVPPSPSGPAGGDGSEASKSTTSRKGKPDKRASDPAPSSAGDSDRLATIRVPATGSDIGSFLKLSTLQAAGMSMFAHDMFRAPPSAAPLESRIAPLFEVELSTKPDMSFVGAPVVGAGFNTKSSTILKGPMLLPMGANPDSKLTVVKGQDGHFYHADA